MKAPTSADHSQRHAWLISIGSELTLGQTIDTNASWLAKQLAEIGMRVVQFSVVADDLAAIQATLALAAGSAELVICTGGLGPTEDDLTRQALALAAGAPLVSDTASLRQIRAFFERRGREMPERNAVQALVPAGAFALENTCGSAPGVRVQIDGAVVFALPGVPFEMKQMFARDVAPALLRPGGSSASLRSRLLHTMGLGESEVGERIRDLMARGRNPEVGTTAANGLVGVRLNALASSGEQAGRMLDDAEREICGRLGPVVFGRDAETLAEVVGRRLCDRNETLSAAESCSGGWISKRVTDVPGSSRYFAGGVVAYSNAIKTRLLGVSPELLATHGAVSAPVASAMASGCRERLMTTYALSVTGIAGPDGGSESKPVGLVYIALATPEGVTAHAQQFGADAPRELIRLRSVNHALNLLRLFLLNK